MGIGERLRLLIKATGNTNKSFAELTGVAPNYISILIKKDQLNDKFIFTIKKVIENLNIKWLQTGEGEMFVNSNEKVEGFIEVQGVKVSFQEWALKTAEHAKELKKIAVFDNIIKIEKMKDFISFTSHLTPEDLKLLNKDAVKEFLGE